MNEVTVTVTIASDQFNSLMDAISDTCEGWQEDGDPTLVHAAERLESFASELETAYRRLMP